MGKCNKKCLICPTGPTGPASTVTGPTGSSGVDNLMFVNDVSTTVPVANIINTSGVGGNVTVGNGSNSFQIQDHRSITSYIVGSDPATSEYQTIQSAVSAIPLAGGIIVIPQPGTYTENITFTNGGGLDGLAGVTLIGNITIPAGVNVALRALTIRGTIDFGGASLLIDECFINPAGASCLLHNGGFALLIRDTIMINSSAGFPSLSFLPGGGPVFFNNGIVSNDAGACIVWDQNFFGEAEIRSVDLTGSMTIRPSAIISECTINGAGGVGVVDLIVDNDNDRRIVLNNNRIGSISAFNITYDGVNPNRFPAISLFQNFFELFSDIQVNVMDVIVSGDRAVVLFNGNTHTFTGIDVVYTGNTVPVSVIIDDDFFFGGGITGIYASGTPGVMFTSNNTMVAGSGLSFTDTTFIATDNVINNAGLLVNTTLATPLIMSAQGNWISNPVGSPVLGSLAGAAHVLNLTNNTVASDGGGATVAYSIALAGGSIVQTNGVNAVSTTNPVASFVPVAMGVV